MKKQVLATDLSVKGASPFRYAPRSSSLIERITGGLLKKDREKKEKTKRKKKKKGLLRIS
jgi:hypothetical protein